VAKFDAGIGWVIIPQCSHTLSIHPVALNGPYTWSDKSLDKKIQAFSLR